MAGEARKSTEGPSRIDWNAIRQRLELLGKGISLSFSPPRSVKERILNERAERLRRPSSDESSSSGFIDVLFFQLSGEDYGIESKYVNAVQPLDELTALPGIPAFILGIVNLRGRIVSVVDLRKLFDLPQRGLSDQDRVVVISDGQIELALLANVIVGISAIGPESVGEPLATFTGFRRELLKGMTRERVAILDGARLLSDEHLKIGKRGE